MLIYEVNLSVDKETAPAFAEWLKPHIKEVVRVGRFESAEWFERDPGDEGLQDKTRILWTIHYRVKDRSTLDNYLERHAPRLREDGLQKFPGKFTATRRILELYKPHLTR